MKMSGLPNILPPAPFIACALPWSRPYVVKNIFEHQYFSMAEKASRENILQWVFLAKKHHHHHVSHFLFLFTFLQLCLSVLLGH